MTTKQFNDLLHMAVEKYNLDPKQTYIEITWWDHIFRPLITEDCDRETSSHILVFGDIHCQTYKQFSTNEVFPTGFSIWTSATDPSQVVHHPFCVSQFLDSPFMLEFEQTTFLFSNSPLNYEVGINPWKTAVYKNRNGETILVLYVDNRDGGELLSFSEFTADEIKYHEDFQERVGKDDSGETTSEKPFNPSSREGCVLLSDLIESNRPFKYNGETIAEAKPVDEVKPIDLKKTLSTNQSLSKGVLIEYLEYADIPNNAHLTLKFKDGRFYLFFYWSEGAGSFGHRAVDFDIEAPFLMRDLETWQWKQKAEKAAEQVKEKVSPGWAAEKLRNTALMLDRTLNLGENESTN